VIEIGARLTECKRLCGHGQWLPWLDREFGWTSEDTALRFMQVHELGKSRNLRDLTLPVSSLYLLAAPSTPDDARDAVLDLAADGQKLTHAEIKQTISDAKAKASDRAGGQPARKSATGRSPTRPPRRASGPPIPPLNPLAWSQATAEQRTRFVSTVGLANLMMAAPPHERDAVLAKACATIAAPVPAPPSEGGLDDIPTFLRRAAS
jgi:hypothetical protein